MIFNGFLIFKSDPVVNFDILGLDNFELIKVIVQKAIICYIIRIIHFRFHPKLNHHPS